MSKIDIKEFEVYDEYKDLPKWKRYLHKVYDYLYDLIPYPIYHFYCDWISPRTYYNRIRYFIQRRIRGFDDRETWNLDYTFLEWFLPRLKRFNEVTMCYPDRYKSISEYNKELDERVKELENILKYYNNEYEFPIKVDLTEVFKASNMTKKQFYSQDEYILNRLSFDEYKRNFIEWFSKNIYSLWW